MSKSQSRQQTSRQRASRRRVIPFAGVDGEGGDIDGSHEYLLLRAGEFVLETGRPLEPYECFEFLADLRKDRVYVSFAFDYDVTMMIRHLHPSKVALLFERKRREIFKDGKSTGRYYPVDVGNGEFQIDYMPHKEFKVRRPGHKWTVISDTFTFFQSSFVTALRKWFVDQPEYAGIIEKIAEGKDQRNEFTYVTEYERDYNRVECTMLEMLMEKFRDLCTELDIRPNKWQGPGFLVTAVFKREGMPRDSFVHVPDHVWWTANRAYYGGRFECAAYGNIEKEVWQYDINSAYAASYRKLPCLHHGEWQELRKLPRYESSDSGHDDARMAQRIYVAEVSFKHRVERRWYTLPLRSSKGSLLFPREGRGVYWSPELEVAREHCDIEVHGGYEYVSNCDCRYFDWVYDLYAERDSAGKQSGKGKILKIVLATIYGKLAQSKGHPVFSNPIWSGLIVSACRAKLIQAALSSNHGDDVLMLATDGMFTTSPRTLPVGKALGEWELTRHDNMFIVMSGVYFAGEEKPKTRGVPMAKVIQHEMEFRDTWNRYLHSINSIGLPPIVAIPMRVFTSARLAHARKKPWTAGQWVESEKRIAFEWATKRCEPTIVGAAMWTMPVEGGPDLVSQEFDGLIGGPKDLELEGSPDWADRLNVWDDE